MIALYIIGGIIILFLLSLLIKITVSVSYINDLQVKVKILFIKIKLFPFEKEIKQKKKTEVKKEKHISTKKQKPPKPQPPLKDTLLLIKDLVVEIIEKFGKYIKIEEYKVKVLVATDDPAKTGILYGVVSGILGSVSVIIDRIKRHTHKKGRIYTEVKPDFFAEESELYFSAALSLRVWQLLSMGITASKGLLRYNSLRKEISKKSKIISRR